MRGRRRWWAAFAEGVAVQLANPKAAIFVIAIYPQFVPPDGPVFATTALLGLLQIGLETGLYLALAAGVARAGAWFRRPADRQTRWRRSVARSWWRSASGWRCRVAETYRARERCPWTGRRVRRNVRFRGNAVAVRAPASG